MAVALRIPTLAVFNYNNREHFHDHPWVKCVIIENKDDMRRLQHEMDDLLCNTAYLAPSTAR
jgi:hypothetical protein